MGNANVNASSGGGSSGGSSSSNRHQKGGGQQQHLHHRSIDDDDGSRGGKGKSDHHQQHRQHGGGNAVVVHGDEDAARLGPMAYGESMLHSPPDSPSSVSRSPLMFTPQIPMVPINRGDEFTSGPYQSNMCDPRELGNVHEERGVPTMIVWSYGGNNVSVEGSWDNWRTRQPLQKVGKDFMIVKMLPSGVYQYKIILDKDWHYPEEVHAAVLNHLDVKDYVPENLDSVAGFEPPSSPVSSYSNTYPSPEDFAKEPPALPSHLHLTLLNVPPFEEATGLLPRPQHVTLNHLYVEKGKNVRSVLALGLTHRYRSKYVTVALYKPTHK